MKYSDLVKTVMETRELLKKFEKKSMGKTWGNEEILIGLVTDVGDLARLILAKEGFRSVNGNLKKALRHELADCLWAIIVLSEKYNVDLSEALLEMSANIKSQTHHYSAKDHLQEIEKHLGKSVDHILINSQPIPQLILQHYQQLDEYLVKDNLPKHPSVIRTNLLSDKKYQKPGSDILKRSLLRHHPQKLAKTISQLFNS